MAGVRQGKVAFLFAAQECFTRFFPHLAAGHDLDDTASQHSICRREGETDQELRERLRGAL